MGNKYKTKTEFFENSSRLRLFLSYYRPHMKLFLIDMLCALFISTVDLAFPYVSKLSMERLLPQGIYSVFFTVMGIMVAAYITRSLLYYVVTSVGHRFGVLVETDIRADLFDHIRDQSFSFFDKNRTGMLMSRMTTDLFEVAELAHHGPEDIFISTVTLIGAFCVMCSIEWRLACIVFAIVPIFLVFSYFTRGGMRRANLQIKVKTGEINAQIESSLSGMRTAKAFSNEDEESSKFSVSNGKLKTAKNDYYRQMGIFFGGMEFAMSIMSVLVIMAGGLFIMNGTLNYIELITFSLYVSTFIMPIRRLSNFYELFMQGMAGFTRFVEIMRTKPDITDSPGAGSLLNVRGEIEFNDVTFAYSGERNVLKNFSLKVEAGKKYAIVGPSGGGKTTMCQLIPRFYDVTGGAILVDGHDVRDVTQSSLRKNIGIVQQDVFLFAGTIMDNIRYGRPEATDEEVVEAAKRAEIHGDIMEMPDGYESYVGERGTLLSGGQKQRISIARIFLKDPPVLILDEATSALDSVTESRIQASFDLLSVGRTTIVIAHRLSTVKNADRIVVIEDGIRECGTHDELLEKNGDYAELYRTQTFS